MKQRILYTANNPLVATKKQKRAVAYFWYGFLVFLVTAILILFGNKYLSGSQCQAIQIVALAFMISGSVTLMRYKFDDKYLKNVFTIYFLYSITVVARGIELNYNALKTTLLDGAYGILPYLTPLAILLPRKMVLYKQAFLTHLILGILFIIFIIVYYDVIHTQDWMSQEALFYVEVIVGTLGFPAGFLLSIYMYNKRPVTLFTLLVMLVAIFFLIYRARRGALFLCITSVAGAGMMYLIYTKRTLLVIFISIILVTFSTFFLSGIKAPGMFSFLMARQDEDTRSGVEGYMRASMHSRQEWMLGKGMNGKYFCPIVMNQADKSYERGVIETGYLQIVLKGGYISLILLLCMLVPAVFKGFFDSKNMFCKAAAMFIVLWMVSLYPSVPNNFSMNYLFLWIAVGICYSEKLRQLPDAIIKTHLQRFK